MKQSYNAWYNKFREAALEVCENKLAVVVCLAMPPHTILLDRWDNNEDPKVVAAEFFGGNN